MIFHYSLVLNEKKVNISVNLNKMTMAELIPTEKDGVESHILTIYLDFLTDYTQEVKTPRRDKRGNFLKDKEGNIIYSTKMVTEKKDARIVIEDEADIANFYKLTQG